MVKHIVAQKRPVEGRFGIKEFREPKDMYRITP